MLDISLAPRGAWFDLAPSDDGRCGVIRVMPQVGAFVRDTLARASIVGRDINLDLPDFLPPREGAWGFGEVVHQRGAQGGLEWSFPFPTQPSDRDLTALSASLYYLFTALNMFDGAVSMLPQQLLTIHLRVTPGELDGGAVNASVSPQFARWIREHLQDRRDDVIVRMAAVDDVMFSRAQRHPMSSRVDVLVRSDGRFSLYLDGGMGAGLYPDSRYRSEGFNVQSDNFDALCYQYPTLAGLFRMHQLARADGY